ncbi:glycosyl hydrolase family 28 protein [Termitidicoccus mucosus]
MSPFKAVKKIPIIPALALALVALTLPCFAKPIDLPITETGAIGDGKTLNTKAIQAAIDKLAACGGGTIIVPKGEFITGAIFLKSKVNLKLEEGAVLKGSTNIADYPTMPTRMEGWFLDWIPALVNADGCDGLQITGPGTIDGNGQTFYVKFWSTLKADKSTKNLDVKRPRLTFIRDSKNVHISGVKFKDSGFWTLHLYRCTDVLIENSSFVAPYRKETINGKRIQQSASTDGTNLDSCQRVIIRGCYYSVKDDCIAMKGSNGPLAHLDKDSPPVENIRISDCEFAAGHGVITCGSDATVVRDVILENCRVTGKIPLLRMKLRPDTQQLYEDIHVRNVTLAAESGSFRGEIFDIRPWRQYLKLKEGEPPLTSMVRNVSLTNVTGYTKSFGAITADASSQISDIHVENVDVRLENENLKVNNVTNLTMKNVAVNGKPYAAPAPNQKSTSK